MKIWAFCIFILFTLSGAFSAFSQEFAAKGVLINKTTKNRIVLAEISNKRSGAIVGSDDMGFFSIAAKSGDTLVIQKRDYAAVTVVVSGQKEIVVHMVPDFLSIDGVTIHGQNQRATLDAMKRDYKSKGSFYGGKPPLLSFVLSPITAFYELFGKTPKNARRFGKYYATETQQTYIDGMFNNELVKMHTGLDGKKLEDFMINYRPDIKVVEKWTTYDAIKYIKTSYTSYTDTLGRKK